MTSLRCCKCKKVIVRSTTKKLTSELSSLNDKVSIKKGVVWKEQDLVKKAGLEEAFDKVRQAEYRLERQRKKLWKQQAIEPLLKELKKKVSRDSVKPRSRPRCHSCRHMTQLSRKCSPLPTKCSQAHPCCERTSWRSQVECSDTSKPRDSSTRKTCCRDWCTLAKCSKQAKYSSVCVRTWLQRCLLLGLLKGVGSTALYSTHCQALPQWNMQGTCHLGNRTSHQELSPEGAPQQEQDLLQMKTQGLAGKAWEAWMEWEEVLVISVTSSPSGRPLPED